MIDILSALFWLVSMTCLAAGLIIVIRSERVYAYRTSLLAQVSAAAQMDIDAGRFDQWEWRFEELRSVTYDEMMKKWWRPLDSFYPDRNFLAPEGQPDHAR